MADLIVDCGEVQKRKKKQSEQFRGASGHTALSVEEDVPWKCQTLVIGTGANGALPVMDEVKKEAERPKVELIILPTGQGSAFLSDGVDRCIAHAAISVIARATSVEGGLSRRKLLVAARLPPRENAWDPDRS